MKKIILLLIILSLLLIGCGPSPLGPGGAYISPSMTNNIIILAILTPGNYNGQYLYGYTVNNVAGYGDTEIEKQYTPGQVEMNITKLDTVASPLKLNVTSRQYFDDGQIRENVMITGETNAPGGNVVIQGNI